MNQTSKFRMVNRGNLIAFADICYGDITINGLKILQGQNGLWVGMPSRTYQNKDGNKAYASIVWIEDEDRRRSFQNWILKEFKHFSSSNHEATAAV